MMGHHPPAQAQLFYTGFNLNQRVRQDHPLRRVAKQIDFEFSYAAVADKYGDNGNVSVPPPVILKLMLLLVFYNVRSERELMGTLPERLDWLWFLGYDLDSEIPDHSVLSKARKRWGEELFKEFFGTHRLAMRASGAGRWIKDIHGRLSDRCERGKRLDHGSLLAQSAALGSLSRVGETPH